MSISTLPSGKTRWRWSETSYEKTSQSLRDRFHNDSGVLSGHRWMALLPFRERGVAVVRDQ